MASASVYSLIKDRLGRYLFPLLWIATALSLIIYGLSEHVHYYVSVEQLTRHPTRYDGTQFRLGGFVVPQSLFKSHTSVSFDVSGVDQYDHTTTVRVVFNGGLPALFREGKAMVADGRYDSGVFYASEILAKHDENYKIPV